MNELIILSKAKALTKYVLLPSRKCSIKVPALFIFSIVRHRHGISLNETNEKNHNTKCLFIFRILTMKTYRKYIFLRSDSFYSVNKNVMRTNRLVHRK